MSQRGIWYAIAGLIAGGLAGARAETATLESDTLAVQADSAFPRIIEYRWKADNSVLHGQDRVLSALQIDGTNYQPQVSCTRPDASTAAYTLKVAELGVEVDVRLTVRSNVVDWAVSAIREAGAFRVHTLAVPEHGLLCLTSDEPGASVIASRVPSADVQFAVAGAKADAKPVGYTHVVFNTTKLAASLWNNVLLDSARIWVQSTTNGAQTVCRAWCPAWTWREVDAETVELPLARIVITGDRNGDGAVDWQDGALAYRAIEPLPFGADYVRNRVVSQIAMNFASWAQHPFLRVLDNVKKVYLWTDGLGQQIQFKGYQSEGHDSSHPDYGGNVGRRQGGRDELNFVMKRMKDFNATAGVHINATEYYPEALTYSLDLVNTNKHGWAWLDQSYYTDQRYDITSGKLYQRLDAMKADLPSLDWVYVDVYFGTGWNARKLAQRINANGWSMYTEFPGLEERYVTWNHTSQDWTQKIWGDGRKSRLARFIQHQTRDTWEHDPLLRGSNCDGFMGWHSERDLNVTIRSTFAVNLPSKYLQHFALRRWTDERIEFEGGVTAEKKGDLYLVSRDGKLWNSCRYPQPNRPPEDCVLFMPWDPIRESKIYHWNDNGGATSWDLPRSWAQAASVRLYRLTDTGRVFVCNVPVVAGRVTIQAAARTPYVLYKEEPPALPEIVWGENALVKDPGFDSGGFQWWVPDGGASENVRIEDDTKGQTHLRVQGRGGRGTEVRQVLYNLEGGATYSASVWVELQGKRSASLIVRPFEVPRKMVRVPPAGWKIVRADSESNGDKEGPAALAIDDDLGTIWHTQYQGAQPGHPHELVVDMGKTIAVHGLCYAPRMGASNGTIREYRFFVSQDGANWGEAVAQGSFDTADKTDRFWKVVFPPLPARYFKFVTLAEAGDQPFASAAEIGVLQPEPAAAAPAFTQVSCRVEKTDVRNFSDNGDKYLTGYQRIKVLFDLPKGEDKAVLVLRAEDGDAESCADFDDARVVKIARTDPGKHTYFEDFENVDEGCGPFVYGYRGSMRMHLSEAHPPFTDDVVDGRYSLKTFDESNGLNYRTTPALLKFRPNTKYRLTFDYLTRNENQYKVVVRSDEGGEAAEKLAADLPGKDLSRQRFTAEFTTGPFGDYYIGMVKSFAVEGEQAKAEKAKGRDPRAVLVIDNLAVDELAQ